MRKHLSFITVLLVALIDYMGIGLVYPLFASLLFDPELSFLPADSSHALRGAILGILISLMPLMQFFSAPILGVLSDQKGRRKILIFCLAIGVVGYFISVLGVLYSSLSALLVSRVLIGISGGSAAVVQAAIADFSTKENKTKNFGLFNMMIGLGYTIGPFLGGKLADPNFFGVGEFSLPFLFGLGAIFLNLLFVYWYFAETLKTIRPASVHWAMSLSNIKKAFSMKGIRILLLCAFIYSFGWSFFFEFIPVFLIGEYAFTPPEIGNFYAYAGLVYAVSCGFLIRPVIRKFSSETILFTSLIIAGFLMLVFLWIEQPIFLLAYLPCLLFFIALVYPTMTAMVSNWSGEEKQGEMLGIMQSVQSIAFAVSPLFSGTIVGLYITMPIILGGNSMILAGLVFGAFLWLASSVKTEKTNH